MSQWNNTINTIERRAFNPSRDTHIKFEKSLNVNVIKVVVQLYRFLYGKPFRKLHLHIIHNKTKRPIMIIHCIVIL